MKNIALLSCLLILLSACDGEKAEEPENTAAETKTEAQVSAVQKKKLWESVKGEPEIFSEKFSGLDKTQKYYFCAAFSVGAMSVSKPATASAMVKYFIGLGKARYGQGIDDATYQAFDFGKNIFRYELVVNKILDDKICEKIMLDAAEFAQEKKYSVEYLNDLGKPEVGKIVGYLQGKTPDQQPEK